MAILSEAAIEEIGDIFFKAGIVETQASEVTYLNGTHSDKFAFFNTEAGYGAHITATPEDNVEIRLLDVAPDEWDGIAGWDLVHLFINKEGDGTRILRMRTEGTFTVKLDLSGVDLLKLIRSQYPEELSWLNKLNLGE